MDKVADLITRIRNAQSAGHIKVKVKHSNLNKNILNVLKNEGYIGQVSVIDDSFAKAQMIEIDLKYFNGRPVIRKIDRVSKPGRRVYISVTEIKPVLNGLGLNVISTSKGVVSDYEAIRENIGGELLFKVF